jgi:hypothetical protein
VETSPGGIRQGIETSEDVMRGGSDTVWQLRRSEFNHQWLKNRFLSSLDTIGNVLSGRIRSDGYIADFLRDDLTEWPSRSLEARSLLESFDTEMAPSVLFDAEPLDGWEIETRDAAAKVIDELWQRRYSGSQLVADGLLRLEDVDAQYDSLAEYAGGEPRLFETHEFRQAFQEFRMACRDLARAIEKLPSRIRVV